ncbi:hypothetical protein D9M68_833110 [compost metagenome]
MNPCSRAFSDTSPVSRPSPVSTSLIALSAVFSTSDSTAACSQRCRRSEATRALYLVSSKTSPTLAGMAADIASFTALVKSP